MALPGIVWVTRIEEAKHRGQRHGVPTDHGVTLGIDVDQKSAENESEVPRCKGPGIKTWVDEASLLEELDGGPCTIEIATLVSPNGAYRLLLQRDGNLVVTRLSDAAVQFETLTYRPVVKRSHIGHELVLRRSGKLRLLDASGSTVWKPATQHAGATSLKLTNAGRLVLTSASGSVLWTS